MSNSDQEEPEAIGNLLNEPNQTIIEAFNGKASYGEEFYTDEYGTFMPAAAPIFDNQHQAVAVVGLDYSAQAVKNMEFQVELSTDKRGCSCH